MPLYAVPGNQSLISTLAKTAAAVYASASATRRGLIMEMLMSQSTNYSSTDTSVTWSLDAQTLPSTSLTAYTPSAFNPADGVAQATAGINGSTEGTVTANSARFGPHAINQRNSWAWRAYTPDQAIIYAASSGIGFALRAFSPLFVGGVYGNINFSE